MAISYPALKSEILNDPQTYGYAAFVTSHEPEKIADLLNKVRDGTDGEAAITVRRADIKSSELLEAIDTRDFINSPNALAASWFESITQAATIRLVNPDGTNTRAIGNFSRVINDTNGSQSRLSVLANRFGTRAEQLFGTGTFITPADVGAAMSS